MWKLTGSWVLLAVMAGCGGPGGDLPRYVCRYSSEAPRVDGRLDEPAWQRAAVMELVRADNGSAPRQPTTVRAFWTDNHLCIGFQCVDNDIWAATDQHDGDIYEHEVVEVFVDSNLDGKSYLELEVSPNNTVLDMFVLNPGGGRRFQAMREYESAGLMTATTLEGSLGSGKGRGAVGDRGWTVEIAIPFESLVLASDLPPLPGQKWRWNLYRIDRPATDKDEYSAWSPTVQINYHQPERFGWLIFSR